MIHWAKLAHRFDLDARVTDAGNAAAGLYARLLVAADRLRTGRTVPVTLAVTLAGNDGVTLVETLVTHGLAFGNADGNTLDLVDLFAVSLSVDGASAERSKVAQKQANYRERKRNKVGNAGGNTTGNVTGNAPSRASDSDSDSSSLPPVEKKDPPPTPSGNADEDTLEAEPTKVARAQAWDDKARRLFAEGVERQRGRPYAFPSDPRELSALKVACLTHGKDRDGKKLVGKPFEEWLPKAAARFAAHVDAANAEREPQYRAGLVPSGFGKYLNDFDAPPFDPRGVPVWVRPKDLEEPLPPSPPVAAANDRPEPTLDEIRQKRAAVVAKMSGHHAR